MENHSSQNTDQIWLIDKLSEVLEELTTYIEEEEGMFQKMPEDIRKLVILGEELAAKGRKAVNPLA